MENTYRGRTLALIGFLGASAVSLGALGAHALKNQLGGGLISLDQLNGFDTAVRYQIYHTLAIMIVMILQQQMKSKFLKWAQRLFLAGILFFSGSLYLLCTRGLTGIEGLKILGPVTPLGGLLFVAGWLCLAAAAFKRDS